MNHASASTEQPRPMIAAAHVVFWQALERRLAELAPAFPASLVGVVQIELDRGLFEPAYAQLILEGPASRGLRGLAPQCDAWISTSEEDLEALLAGQIPESLRIQGNAGLVDDLLDAIAPASVVQLRALRSRGV